MNSKDGQEKFTKRKLIFIQIHVATKVYPGFSDKGWFRSCFSVKINYDEPFLIFYVVYKRVFALKIAKFGLANMK